MLQTTSKYQNYKIFASSTKGFVLLIFSVIFLAWIIKSLTSFLSTLDWNQISVFADSRTEMTVTLIFSMDLGIRDVMLSPDDFKVFLTKI